MNTCVRVYRDGTDISYTHFVKKDAYNTITITTEPHTFVYFSFITSATETRPP